jgi:hypothetical protein
MQKNHILKKKPLPYERGKDFTIGHGFIFPFHFFYNVFFKLEMKVLHLWTKLAPKCTLHNLNRLLIIYEPLD